MTDSPVRMAHPESALVVEVLPVHVERYASQGWHPALSEPEAEPEADTPLIEDDAA